MKRTDQKARQREMIKEPKEWVTRDEPMTGAQDSYVHTLAHEAGEALPQEMTKAEASEKIENLQEKTGRSPIARRKPRARKAQQAGDSSA